MEYEKVPNIITGKDLDYLSDMFNWNYGAYKSTYNMKQSIKDESLLGVVEESISVFHKNMKEVLEILETGESNE